LTGRSYIHYKLESGGKVFIMAIGKRYPNHQQLLEQCIGRLNGLTTFSKSMAKTIRTDICAG